MNSKNQTSIADNLTRQFQTIMNAPLSTLRENVAGEYVSILSVSDWVHIAIIRNNEHPNRIRIEVEVSLPSGSCGESLQNSADQMDLLQGMMTHITYLRDLLKIGFKLEVIREDCLWVASYLESGYPPREVFEALVPPIVK